MIRAYLDSNIFIFFLNENTNCRKVVNAAFGGLFRAAVSFHSFDEVVQNLKANYNREVASKTRHLMSSIPNILIAKREDIAPLMKKYAELVADNDDLPYIAAYSALNCDFFVTTNRKLTAQKIKENMNFISPKKFVEMLGLESIGTEHDE